MEGIKAWNSRPVHVANAIAFQSRPDAGVRSASNSGSNPALGERKKKNLIILCLNFIICKMQEKS